jgi:hypothetical protein
MSSLADLDHPIRLPPPHERAEPEKKSAVEHGPVGWEVDLGATRDPARFADDFAVFAELEVSREQHANRYEQGAS